MNLDDQTRRQLQAILAGTDFDLRPPVPKRRRLVVEVAGRERGGKTHFLGTAPGNIAYQWFDKGHEGVLDKTQFTNKIIPAEYKVGAPPGSLPQKIAELSQATWLRFCASYAKALSVPRELIGTVGWDTGGELWDILRLARFGQLSNVPQHLYGIPNREYSDLVRMAYDFDKNLVILSKMKKQYKGGEKTGKITDSYWTGEYERIGYNDLPYLVQVCCETSFDPFRKEFNLKIVNCRQRPEITGEVLINADFPMLAMMVYPDSSPEDWQ